MGYNYFPLDSGKYWIYALDSIVFDGFEDRIDTFKLETREMIEARLIDNEGENVYRIAHYYRGSSADPWVFYHYTFAKRDKHTAERVMNDSRSIVLTFPVNDFKSWDANAYNLTDYQLLRIKETGRTFQSGQSTYENCVRVEQLTQIDPYFHTEGHTYYGWNIGMIYTEERNTETQNGKTNGYYYKKTLLDTNW